MFKCHHSLQIKKHPTPHCPISKNAFFDKIPDMVNNSDLVDEEIIRKKLEKARMHGVSVLKGAIWVKSYLETKIMYLEQNRGKQKRKKKRKRTRCRAQIPQT